MKTNKTLLSLKLLGVSLCWMLNMTFILAQTPVAKNGQLSVSGTKLVNQYGNPIQLRGMSSHGIQWHGWNKCLTESSLDVLAYEWGADIFRIAMYVQEGGYETNPTGYTNQVHTLINEATERGMYALVDFHMLSPGDPTYNLNNAKTFFTAIANQHKNKNNIIYEICNEPNGVSWATIKAYAEQIIPVIRAIDPDAVIIVGTPGWSSLGLSQSGPPDIIVNNKLNYPNIMYTFHFYAASHASYVSEVNRVSDLLPIFVTEFGTQQATGGGGNDFTSADNFINLFHTKKISWVNWNYSDDPLSGAAWIQGTCGSNTWTPSRLKPAGAWVRERIMSPADDFPGGTPNNPPTVSISSPANGASFTTGASVNITANAADANGTVAKVEFFVDAVKIGEDLSSPYTFAWTATTGSHSLAAKATDNQGAATTSTAVTITVTQIPVTQSPYGGTVRTIPGIIEAEHYDLGGQTVSFNDATPSNEGASFRTDAVDVEATTDAGAGYNVGWITAGEWLEYTVNVATAGTYKLEARVAALTGTRTFHVELNGQNISGPVTVPATGGWQNWTTVSVTTSSLTAGQKVLRIVMDGGDFNLNHVTFSEITTTPNNPPTASITSPANGANYTAPASVTINASATDTDGTISNVGFYNGATLLFSDNAAPYAYTWSGVTAGSYSLTVRATDNDGATTTSSPVTITVTQAPVTQSPYGGTARTIPGKIEAEHYDMGGQAVAFSDATTANEGAAFRTDAVDVEATTDAEAGYNVGWITAGEWLEYTVNVATAGAYKLEARVAALTGSRTIHFELNGVNISGPVTIPATGGWQNWTTVSVTTSSLTAGQKVLRIVMDGGDFNLNHVTFSEITSTPNSSPTASISSPANGAILTAPATITINASASDSDGSVSKVDFYNGNTLLSSDATAPFSYTLNGAAAGTYNLKVVATDNEGATGTSSIVTVTVNNPNNNTVGINGPSCVQPGVATSFTLNPDPGFSTAAWWTTGDASTTTSADTKTATITYTANAIGSVTISAGANFSTSPWYKEYTKTVTVSNACAAAEKQSASIVVTPQPFNEAATISVDNGEVILSANVYDAQGNEIMRFDNLGLNEVSIGDNLEAGIYFIKIVTEKGSYTQRIIKSE